MTSHSHVRNCGQTIEPTLPRARGSQVIENVRNCAQTIEPLNEAQVRPLTKLETAEAQQAAWQMVVETAPEGKITAYHVSKVVSGIKKETIKEEVKKKAKKAKSINKEHLHIFGGIFGGISKRAITETVNITV